MSDDPAYIEARGIVRTYAHDQANLAAQFVTDLEAILPTITNPVVRDAILDLAAQVGANGMDLEQRLTEDTE